METPPDTKSRRRRRVTYTPETVMAVLSTALKEAESVLTHPGLDPADKLKAVHAVSQAATTFARLYDVWYMTPLAKRMEATLDDLQEIVATSTDPKVQRAVNGVFEAVDDITKPHRYL